MCGIIGYVGNKNALSFLIEGLFSLEYRGYDSAGVAVIKNDKINTCKTLERVKKLKEKTEMEENFKGFLGIGHTRWATHGKVSKENAHPILSQNKEFCVVHNGIIENYIELKNELINDGVKFLGETDTEVIVNLISKYYKDNLLKAVKKAEKRLSGSFSIGVISLKEKDKIIAVKKLSPIVIGLSKDGNFISSDISAIAKYTNKIIYLKDRQIAVLTKDNIEIYDENLKKQNINLETVNFNVNLCEKDGFEHFMIKEIHEQPKIIKRLINRHIKDGEVVFENLSLNKQKIKEFNKIIILACGSAYNAGMVAKYLLEEKINIPIMLEYASEFKYKNSFIDSKTLVLVISQSGETADTISALKEAKQKGGHIISVVNVLSSSIAKESDDVIYTDAGPEIAVATTKAYLAQITVLSLFTIFMSSKLKKENQGEFKAILEEFLSLPDKITEIINKKEKIENLAKQFKEEENIFFIGRNIDYAICMEASLKLKEISYIHSESYPAGELKHGTISLIEEGKRVIALAYSEKVLDKTINNIKEVKVRGANVLLLTKEGNKDLEKEVDQIFYIPNIHEFLSSIIEVISFQLFAYYVAKEKGLDIDKPRNLAKSVTVE